MVEITSEEQNKLKRIKKKLRIVSETSGAISNAATFNRGPRRRREKERV